MNYYDNPQPALIIAHSRSGSTFLCHCLDSHYQIACERGGPFDTYFNKWHELGIPHRDLAAALWQRKGYRVSMFKVTLKQFKNGYVTLDTLREFKPKIIFLRRENVLRAFISSFLATDYRDGKNNHPMHSYAPVKQRALKIDCALLPGKIDDYLERTRKTLQVLSEFDTLELSYEQVVSKDGILPEEICNTICDFLDVEMIWPLYSETVKVNTEPVVTNWKEVQETLSGTEYEWMLA